MGWGALIAGIVSMIGGIEKNKLNWDAQVEAFEQSEAAYAQNVTNIREGAARDYATVMLQQLQQMMAVQTQLEDLARAAKSKKATATVASGEAGVTGNSVDAVRNDISAQRGRASDRLKQNLGMTLDQLDREILGIRHTAQSKINTLPRMNRPSHRSFYMNLLGNVGGSLGGMMGSFGGGGS